LQVSFRLNGIVADSLDMLDDAIVDGFALFVVGKVLRMSSLIKISNAFGISLEEFF
jgi:hypothetical protein